MFSRSLLLLLLGAASPALAQQVPARPSGFPVRHRLVVQSYGPAAFALPDGRVLAAVAAPAPLPTVRAAAAYAPGPAPTGRPSPSPADTLLLVPRYHPAGAVPAPAYNIYENLPEEFRKHTLRAPYTEPLVVQLLRGTLGR